MWACAVVLFTIAVGAPPYEVPCDSDAAFTCLFQGGARQVADAYMRHAVASQRTPLLSDLLIGAFAVRLRFKRCILRQSMFT